MEYEGKETRQAPKEQYLKRVEIFDEALLKRLKNFTPTFLKMRQTMELDGTVGFASFPESHGVYEMGILPDLKKRDDKLYYQVRGFLLPEEELVTPKVVQRILVMPDLSKRTHRIVSIYQRKGWHENGEIEERLLKAPDEVFIGVIAHELSHMFEFGIKKPKFLTDFEKGKGEEIEKFVEKNCPEGIINTQGLVEQSMMDITASLFGFKNAVLAKNKYLKECLSTYDGADDTSYSFMKAPGTCIEEINLRTKAVLNYSARV